MPRLTLKDLPPFDGRGDLLSAKRWFRTMAKLGATFPADEPAYDIVLDDGTLLFDIHAGNRVDQIMDRFHEAKEAWPDPDFIYDLAVVGSFPIERDYPGLSVDRSVPGACATGYASLPGQSRPTLLAEHRGDIVALQFEPGLGNISESVSIHVAPLVNARIGADGRLDARDAVVDTLSAYRVSSFSDIEAAMDGLLSEKARLRSA